MNVVIYARYSSASQNEQSIEGQLKVCQEYANSNNYSIIGKYIDRARSGKTDNRPQFLQMIEDSKKRNFDAVLVYQLDRFSRNIYDSVFYSKCLQDNGVRLISANENIPDDACGLILQGTLWGMNAYYLRELSQKVQRGMQINAQKCFSNGGNIPLGFKIGKDKKFIIDKKNAETVKKIFTYFINGYSKTEIVNLLNSNNLKNSKGNNFNIDNITFILKNEKYRGVYKYGDIHIENGMPRIIDDDTFYKAQNLLEYKSKTKGRKTDDYILTGKLYCGKCNMQMTGTCGISHTKTKYTYYICKNKYDKKCNKKNIPQDFIEDIIVTNAREILTDDNIRKIAKSVVDYANKTNNSYNIKALYKELKEYEKQKTNLLNSLKLCTVNSVSITIIEELDNISKKIEELMNSIKKEECNTIKVEASQIEFFLNEMKKGNINDKKYKKMLVNVLINKIYLFDDSITILFNTQSNLCIKKLPPIEEIEGSFNNGLVHHQGLEPGTN